jgi:hypothetical protein
MNPTTNNGTSSASTEPPQSHAVLIVLSCVGGIFTLALIASMIVIAIITVQANRHPKRCSHRQGKGIARAMLDAIPIVKFSYDMDRDRAVYGDVELASRGDRETTSYANDHPFHHFSTIPRDISSALTVVSAIGALQNGSMSVNCSICTEDFVQGEDIRVLPCRHKFHLPCIEPWLLNISGTCPLW